ncbi:hypothetical protein DFH09DRAFT_1320933 [Mycena vulgaris]|nr:hypothetical protein DFH09DRAFT_1320933 [Mycena vulgaris]
MPQLPARRLIMHLALHPSALRSIRSRRQRRPLHHDTEEIYPASACYRLFPRNDTSAFPYPGAPSPPLPSNCSFKLDTRRGFMLEKSSRVSPSPLLLISPKPSTCSRRPLLASGPGQRFTAAKRDPWRVIRRATVRLAPAHLPCFAPHALVPTSTLHQALLSRNLEYRSTNTPLVHDLCLSSRAHSSPLIRSLLRADRSNFYLTANTLLLPGNIPVVHRQDVAATENPMRVDLECYINFQSSAQFSDGMSSSFADDPFLLIIDHRITDRCVSDDPFAGSNRGEPHMSSFSVATALVLYSRTWVAHADSQTVR